MIDSTKIPLELRSVARWVVWKAQGGTKVPYVAPGATRRASSTDESTWCSFAAARAAVLDGKADGLGFVLGNGYVGIDLDGCRDPVSGKRSELAEEIMAGVQSYSEASPSGKGIHIIVRGQLPDGWRKLGPVEVYSDGRYFTMTGERLGVWNEIEERTALLAELHAQLLATAGERPGNVRTKADPANQLIRSFDSSKGEKDKYTAKIDKTTGKATCNCRGWKYRMRSGKPCWHVQELADELGIEVA
jgi:putative DNA primase/helicase